MRVGYPPSSGWNKLCGVDFRYRTCSDFTSIRVFAFRKFRLWYRPITISLSYGSHYIDENTNQHKVGTTITNITNDNLLITRCAVCGVFPVRTLPRRYLRRPFLRPRLWRTLTRNAVEIDFIGQYPKRLVPKDQLKLASPIYTEYPLHQLLFATGEIRVEVRTSDRSKIFYSRRMSVPSTGYQTFKIKGPISAPEDQQIEVGLATGELELKIPVRNKSTGRSKEARRNEE